MVSHKEKKKNAQSMLSMNHNIQAEANATWQDHVTKH